MTPESIARIVERSPVDRIGHTKLPWNDPGFSRRMLAEHLDQRHDHASRRFATIDAHVEWLIDTLLSGRPGFVLDLGCGPGFYTERLAVKGCTCRGVDISPASIDYARAAAESQGLPCTYVLGDIVDADLGSNHDLAIFLFGELNTFPRDEVLRLLGRVRRCLRTGGRILLEVHTDRSVIAAGCEPAGWYTSSGGLFAAGPHVVLREQKWNDRLGVTNTRYYVIDATSGSINEYGETLTSYTDGDYDRLLSAAGFVALERHTDMSAAPHPDMSIITAIAG